MKIRTKLGIGFGIQVLLTAVLGISALIALATVNRQYTQSVEIDAPVMSNARQLSKLVVDMETGQRGFFITHNEEFLEPYLSGTQKFTELIEIQKNLVRNKPEQIAILKKVQFLLQEWRLKAAGPEIAAASKLAQHKADTKKLRDGFSLDVGNTLMSNFMEQGHQLEVEFSQREDWEAAFVVELIEKCMAEREAYQRGFLITGEEEFLLPEPNTERYQLPAYFQQLRHLVEQRGRENELSEKINQLEQLTHAWETEASRPLIAVRRKMTQHNQTLEQASALLQSGTGKALIDQIRNEFDQFIQNEKNDTDLSYATATQTTTRTQNITITLIILATTIGIIVAIASGQAVAKPLAQLVKGAEDIGHGLFQTHLQSKSTGEFATLIHAFNNMATDLEHAQEKLQLSATTDKLTGLPNRAVFLDRLQQFIKQSQRDHGQFAVLFFDFDRFKVVNDSLGHDIGDLLLCDIAEIFTQQLRDSDTVARFGGDEFVVLLGNLTHYNDAQDKAQLLLKAFAKPHQLNDHYVVSTASIGLVTNEFPYNNPEDMIRDADAAMYQAKDSGKAQVVTFDRDMHAQAIQRLNLEADLRIALAQNQLHLAYQPIVNLETGELDGFEALIRWNHPQLGNIPPLDFVNIAEETGLIVDIGNWTLHKASAQITHWNKNRNFTHPLKVNINISKRQLLTPDFLEEVLHCKKHYNLQPNELHLEITESIIADDRTNIVPLLEQLRTEGFPIVMDDFGTGVSSLSALHQYPIDILKIDQAFISILNKDKSLLTVVASITSMAENLGIPTVAEGIESEHVIAVLQSVGCKWGQGYYFSKPISAQEAENYITNYITPQPNTNNANSA